MLYKLKIHAEKETVLYILFFYPAQTPTAVVGNNKTFFIFTAGLPVLELTLLAQLCMSHSLMNELETRKLTHFTWGLVLLVTAKQY